MRLTTFLTSALILELGVLGDMLNRVESHRDLVDMKTVTPNSVEVVSYKSKFLGIPLGDKVIQENGEFIGRFYGGKFKYDKNAYLMRMSGGDYAVFKKD